jgi:hypothetical protein
MAFCDGVCNEEERSDIAEAGRRGGEKERRWQQRSVTKCGAFGVSLQLLSSVARAGLASAQERHSDG